MRFSFSNRYRELADLRRFASADSAAAGAKLCIVYGPSGIGKSRLVDQAADTGDVHRLFVRVAIKQSDFRYEETGFFLRETALAVSAASKRSGYGLTLDAFAASRRTKNAIRATIGSAVKTAEKMLAGSEAGKDALDAWKTEDQALESLRGAPSTPALRLAADYLRAAASARTLILAIENSQSVDKESLYFLNSLCDAAPSVRIIYEYTTASGSEAGADVAGDFRAKCAADEPGLLEIRVPPLQFDTLVPENFRTLQTQAVESLRLLYEAGKGNVRELERKVDLVAHRSGGGRYADAEGIPETLLGYSTPQKVILWIVALSRRSLDPLELSEIASFVGLGFSPGDPTATAKSLAPFVELRDGSFSIDHDSLLPKLAALAPMRRDSLVAAKALADYFQSFLSRRDYRLYSEYEIVFSLLSLSLPLHAPDLADLAISRLAAGVQAGGRPTGILKLVNEFARQGAGRDLHEQTVRRLIGIIYDGCWLEGAVELTGLYRHSGLDVGLAYCQALALTGRHADAERQWLGLREKVNLTAIPAAAKKRIDGYVWLTGALICRLRGDYKGARERYDAVSPKTFERPDDLSVYFRFGEVADAPDLPARLEQSRAFGRNAADPTHLIRADITLSIIAAESGDLDRARVLLAEAESLEPVSYVDQYMIANNRLVSEMFGGTASASSYARLAELLPLVIDTMDRVLITSNLLAASVLLDDNAAADRLARALRDALSEVVEPNIRRGALFNCGRYYRLQGDEAIARHFQDEAFAMQVRFDEAYWDARRTGVRDPRRDFRLVAEFDLPMMTNWYFSWPDFEATP